MVSRERTRRKRASERAHARQARRDKNRSKHRIRKIILWSFGGAVMLMIVLSLVLPSSLGNVSSSSASYSNGQEVVIQENEVVVAGQEHPDYNTQPPTSGWHYAIDSSDLHWGKHEEQLEDEVQVAYLELGAVLVQYNCVDPCPVLEEALENVTNRYPEGVVLAPFSGMESTIAVTSWGWIYELENFDDSRIDDFIQSHINKGPARFN